MSGKFSNYWSNVYLGGARLFVLAHIDNEELAELSFHQWSEELGRVQIDANQAVKLHDYLSKFYSQELPPRSRRKISSTLHAVATTVHSSPVIKLTLSTEDGSKISSVDLYSDDVLKFISYLSDFLSE